MGKIAVSLVAIVFAMLLFSLVNNEKHSTQNDHDEVIVVSSGSEAPSEILVINEIGKHFTLPIASIPELAFYLQTEPDVVAELARIHYEFLSGNTDHFVLKYGCGNKRCQLLLVELTDSDEVKTMDLGEGIFAGAEVFQQRAMFLLAENEGNEVVRHKLVLVDLATMVPIQPLDPQLAERYFAEALYPIIKFEWVSEQLIRLEAAALIDASDEEVKDWYQAEDAPVRVVEIEL